MGTFGIFLGFSANLAVMDFGDITWRLQLGSAMIPAIPLLLLIYTCPESESFHDCQSLRSPDTQSLTLVKGPRWYMKKERPSDAYTSLQKLRHSKLQAARDLFLMHLAIQQEKELFQRTGNMLKRFHDLFRVPRLRRANLAASTVMLAQQMCGSKFFVSDSRPGNWS